MRHKTQGIRVHTCRKYAVHLVTLQCAIGTSPIVSIEGLAVEVHPTTAHLSIVTSSEQHDNFG